MKPVPAIDFGAHLARLDAVSPVEVKGGLVVRARGVGLPAYPPRGGGNPQ